MDSSILLGGDSKIEGMFESASRVLCDGNDVLSGLNKEDGMVTANPMGAKNRKVLKLIDHDAMKASMVEILGYILVAAWILSSGGFYEHSPVAAMLIGAIIILTALVRISLNLMFDTMYGGGPLRWRRLFFFLSCFQAAGWSAFSVILFYYEGLSINLFSAWLLTLGICSATIIHTAAYLYITRVLVSLFLLPTVLVLVASLEPTNLFMAMGIMVFYMFLIRHAAYLFATFWAHENSQKELRKKIIDLEKAHTKEDESVMVKQQFLQTITHEIRTPMNNILGMLSMLEDSDLSIPQREYQSVATSASESLLDLIDDILDFSKISSGTIFLETHFFNVRHIIRECVEMLGPVAHEKGLELSYVCEPHIPLRVKGDSKRLKQVLVNLVSNAIKYSQEGEVIIEVFMTFPEPGQGILRVHVRDDGPGLALDRQEQVFEAFNRLDKNSDINGTGLGLAVSRGLVGSMGGEIGVYSREGRGSTFWFTLPMKISTQQKESLGAHPSMEGKRILLVGATKGMARFFQVELKEWGIEMDVVADDTDPLNLDEQGLQKNNLDEGDNPALSTYALIIFNMKFGTESMRCLTLSEQFSCHERHHDVPQIILTSLAQRGMVETVEYGSKSQNVSFQTKPVFRKSLYEAILSAWNIELEKPASVAKFPEKQLTETGYAILLVEDNNVNQMVAKGMLKKLGHEIVVVSNGSEALGMLEDRYFDLVLMDCIMPVMDGYDATSHIRQREEGSERHIPVIAMTANTFEGEEQRCLAAGMDDYLAKPVSASALGIKLRRWLGEEVTRTAIINTHASDFQQNSELNQGSSAEPR